MAKVCIFCGNSPEDKNKEHIIPKWLMRMTDTENKKMSVGINWKEGTDIQLNFKAFTFPACTKCNTEFADIEGRMKPIMERILNDDYVSAKDLLLMLDWLDKIRISLSLAISILNKGTFDLEPKYYINQRVGLKDRMLAITNCYDDYVGLRWTGVDTLAFLSSPTCFTMKINNILLTNCSMDFILSRQLGFPYLGAEWKNPTNPKLQDMILENGTHRTENRLFKSNLYSPTTIISQPIFKVTKDISAEKYNNDYVKENSYNYENGEGKLFVTHDNFTYPMEIEEEISFSSENTKKKNLKFNRPTLEFQIELLSSRKIVLNSPNEKRKHESALKYIVDHLKAQITQFDY